MRTIDDGLADTWFRTLNRSPEPRARLVCFPHAGGTASFYRSWPQNLPQDIEVSAVRYPGREDRFLESPADAMEQLVEPIAQACSQLLDRPLGFFGHSMGASVAYEVALRLQKQAKPPLSVLFVSSHSAPGQGLKGRRLAESSDLEMLKHVGLLGGTNEQALANEELWELVLPAIRADYQLIENYQSSSEGCALEVPIVAYYGTLDNDLDEGDVKAWSAVTRSTFEVHPFEGGHFYLMDSLEKFLEDLYARFALFSRPLNGSVGEA